jgi:hypothetical protein
MLLNEHIHEIQNKICKLCGKGLKGRTDKKFCDDYCRNSFNNQLKVPATAVVRNVNNALLKNRRVLETLLNTKGRSVRTSREKLLQLGFNFKYFTHLYTTRQGKTYSFCYDYGWRPLDNDRLLLVKGKN